MRGIDHQQGHVFSYLSPEERVRKDHPLRVVRVMTDEILREMSPLFDAMYARGGRPSIPPEKLLRAQLLQMLYSVRSERLLMEEIDYSMLFRWFVGLNLDEEVWDATTFTKNRDRLLEADVAKEFLNKVVEGARAAGLISDEHFTVDGTLLEAWASLKSFQPKDQKSTMPPDDPGNPTVNFHGERRCNQTHASKSDPDAQLARKGPGKEAKLSYSGNLLVENRNGLIVNAELLEANGRAERDAALLMLEQIPGVQRVTAGADKGYDTAEFVAECRHLGVTPHVARNTGRRGGSAIDTRTTRHPGYATSQRKRKRIEECFGWLKDIALLRKLRHRGLPKVGWIFTFAAATYNLVRMRNLRKLSPQTA
ncbi:MAG TPA: IS5 family transposase [Silvibacterium sp.]|jgi:transposase|nr:IS5 family transposase [Silvibacterium sp.]